MVAVGNGSSVERGAPPAPCASTNGSTTPIPPPVVIVASGSSALIPSEPEQPDTAYERNETTNTDLRANGIELTSDQRFFDKRRRVKNEHELAGIRRACRAVEAGVAVGVELLRSASRSNGTLRVGGEPLTCERIQLEVERAFGEHGAAAEDFIVSHGAQTAVGHEVGSGPIAADDVVLFDLFPRDRESACYSDFTRTFSLGPPSDELAEYHRLAKEALDLAVARQKPGVKVREIHGQI